MKKIFWLILVIKSHALSAQIDINPGLKLVNYNYQFESLPIMIENIYTEYQYRSRDRTTLGVFAEVNPNFQKSVFRNLRFHLMMSRFSNSFFLRAADYDELLTEPWVTYKTTRLLFNVNMIQPGLRYRLGRFTTLGAGYEFHFNNFKNKTLDINQVELDRHPRTWEMLQLMIDNKGNSLIKMYFFSIEARFWHLGLEASYSKNFNPILKPLDYKGNEYNFLHRSDFLNFSINIYFYNVNNLKTRIIDDIF
jgi:hypothetical protein